MKFARYMSLVALAMAVAFLMAVVPSAPKSASAQGPAYRYECNYTTIASKLIEADAAANPGNYTGPTPFTSGTGTSGTTASGTNLGAPNRCSDQATAPCSDLDDTTYAAAALTAIPTYINRDVLFTIAGTGSFSGIANRRQLRARITSTIIDGTSPDVAGLTNPIKSRHVIEFQNYSNNDGVCATSEMCFVALGEGTVNDYAARGTSNAGMGYDQLTPNNDNLNITIAVFRGEQQLRGLCGRLTNSRNTSTSQTDPTTFTPEASPNNNPTNTVESRSELSKLNKDNLVFNFQGALCECQTNKSGPTDYGTQNNQGQ